LLASRHDLLQGFFVRWNDVRGNGEIVRWFYASCGLVLSASF